MSDSCVCPLAGYCERHQCKKTSNLHKLCQQHGAYWDAWEEGRGPGQQVKPKEQNKRRLRVIENVKRNQRLRGWVMSMRTTGEVGIGDTLLRLIRIAGTREIKRELKCLHRACSCNQIEATEKLNREYPYQEA